MADFEEEQEEIDREHEEKLAKIKKDYEDEVAKIHREFDETTKEQSLRILDYCKHFSTLNLGAMAVVVAVSRSTQQSLSEAWFPLSVFTLSFAVCVFVMARSAIRPVDGNLKRGMVLAVLFFVSLGCFVAGFYSVIANLLFSGEL